MGKRNPGKKNITNQSMIKFKTVEPRGEETRNTLIASGSL